ncbi:MAG TPA: MMPL family transporter [Polyangiaceae bacterium]|nr:MMPL family transporter [Polyangiaceae bacterium]
MATGPGRLMERVLARLVDVSARRPFLLLGFAVLSLLPSLSLARKLEIRTGFDELLPEGMPSVVEQRRVASRLPSASTLAVTAESNDRARLVRFLEELAPRARSLPFVTSVEDGPREARRFVRSHAFLYAPLGELERLRDDVAARYDWEIARALGTELEGAEPPELTEAEVRRRLSRKPDPGDDSFLGEDGRLAVLVLRTNLAPLDQRAFGLRDRVARLVEEGHFAAGDPSFRVGYTGNLLTGAEEYRSVVRDLTSVGLAGAALVLAVVFFFFLRLRALVALGVGIGFGLAWCFAFAEVAIGHLNTASGFLVSVVAGNGINAMVIYMARYVEARRDGESSVAGALRTASLGTWSGTLSAVSVAVVAYGALVTTDFRGFRDFGVIGAAGMLLCWIATYAVLPSVLVLAERVSPLRATEGRRARFAALYARPFVALTRRFPAPIFALGALSGVLSTYVAVRYAESSPMEWDLRRVRNDDGDPHSARALARRIGPVVGRTSQSGRALLTERFSDVEPLVHELERRRDAAPLEEKPFGAVTSVLSVLPADQERKLVLARELRERAERARRRGLVGEDALREVLRFVAADSKPLGVSDLPPSLAAPFREANGTVGNVVYVAPTRGRSIDDARYLSLLADAIREVRLPNGTVVRGSGDAVVFSDMLRSIERAAPRILALAVLGAACVVLAAFRGSRSGFIALATLALGVVWLVAALAVFRVRLNFLNFVALPIAVGVGSDYAVNVMKRRDQDGDAALERAFTETGGAVVACSLTTLSGYSALLFSVNGAVRSMGLTAALGELATQFSAMLVLPAALRFFASRRRR